MVFINSKKSDYRTCSIRHYSHSGSSSSSVPDSCLSLVLSSVAVAGWVCSSAQIISPLMTGARHALFAGTLDMMQMMRAMNLMIDVMVCFGRLTGLFLNNYLIIVHWSIQGLDIYHLATTTL